MPILGSYVRNNQKKNSDIGILVVFSAKIGIRFVDLANELEQTVGLKVDLVSKNGIKAKYLQKIDSDLIYV